jgi:hypothetical protein
MTVGRGQIKNICSWAGGLMACGFRRSQSTSLVFHIELSGKLDQTARTISS